MRDWIAAPDPGGFSLIGYERHEPAKTLLREVLFGRLKGGGHVVVDVVECPNAFEGDRLVDDGSAFSGRMYLDEPQRIG